MTLDEFVEDQLQLLEHEGNDELVIRVIPDDGYSELERTEVE